MMNPKKGKAIAVIRGIFLTLLCLLSIAVTAYSLFGLFMNNSDPGGSDQNKSVDIALMDRYDMQMTNTISNALDGVLSIRKVYWLSDDDQVAPEPDPACFGETTDPSTLQWLLDDAAELLDGQETYFSTKTQLAPNSKVTYYLDESILAITWKENINGMMFTISEVKIAHASQFRRFLAGGEYGSAIQLTTTEMATSVNAVVASAGDFYKYRRAGIIVYDGKLQRMDGVALDTCFVDENGDMHFSRRGEMTTEEEVKKFITENKIRFSFAFGPVIIENGVRCEPSQYPLGEIYDQYSRSGIGQKGELHYIMTTVNREYYGQVPSIFGFGAAVERFGCDKFYTLDGGQTASIAMNDKLINNVDYGSERKISDIIYFATAVPDGG